MSVPPVSHTTDDLVFLWDPNVPLEVDPIELPQLDLVSNITGDCTHIYATGQLSETVPMSTPQARQQWCRH